MSVSVRCGICDEQIDVVPTWPLRIVEQDGKQAVATNYTAGYEHMRDTHPEEWTDVLAAEYEEHKLENRWPR